MRRITGCHDNRHWWSQISVWQLIGCCLIRNMVLLDKDSPTKASVFASSAQWSVERWDNVTKQLGLHLWEDMDTGKIDWELKLLHSEPNRYVLARIDTSLLFMTCTFAGCKSPPSIEKAPICTGCSECVCHLFQAKLPASQHPPTQLLPLRGWGGSEPSVCQWAHCAGPDPQGRGTAEWWAGDQPGGRPQPGTPLPNSTAGVLLWQHRRDTTWTSGLLWAHDKCWWGTKTLLQYYKPSYI